MKKIGNGQTVLAAAALAVLAGILPWHAARAADPVEGLWLVENGKAVVEMKSCDQDSLCGAIRWLRDDAKQYDYKNPDESKRHTPLCGMQILWGFTHEAAGSWDDGKIYKADDGDIYHAIVSMNDDGTLHLRGHVGISLLGKSQTWARVNAADYPRCTGPVGAYDEGKAEEQSAPAPTSRGMNE